MKLKKFCLITATVALLTASLCGCGDQNSESTTASQTVTESTAEKADAKDQTTEKKSEEKTEKKEEKTTEKKAEEKTTEKKSEEKTTEKKSEEKTTEKKSEEKTEEKTTEAAADEEYYYFGRGVYEVTADDAVVGYYCFYDVANGDALNVDSGTGLAFTCDQSKDKVVYHMGGEDDNTEMHMWTNDSGQLLGKYPDTNKVYVFNYLADSDPYSFKEQFLGNDEDLFAGTYVEPNAGRCTITITKGEGYTYNVFISWSSSAAIHSEWTFSGEFDGRQVLNYNDCTMTTYEYDEDGNENITTDYTDGTGYIHISEGGIDWQDDQDNVAADTVFTKQY